MILIAVMINALTRFEFFWFKLFQIQQFINNERGFKMKKRRYYIAGFLVFILVAAFLLPALATAQSKSTMNIKFSTWHPPPEPGS